MKQLDTVSDQESLVRQAAEAAVAEARRQGASSAEAGASVNVGLSVNVRKGEVETLEHHRGQSLSISVYLGHRKGSASSSDLSGDAIRDAVGAALAIARHTSEDECAGLADPERMAREIPDLDLYHPWDLSPEAAIELATECEAAALAVDKRITNSEGAAVNTFGGFSAYANSHGFCGLKRGTRHSLNCSVIAEDDNGMQRDYAYTVSRVPDQLDSARKIGEEAAERTLRRLSGRKLDTREAPVLFAADISRGLLGSFINAISGGALYRRSSFLLDSLETQVFPDAIHIFEAPHLRQALGSAAFDNEGVATRERDIVADGVVKGYVLGSYSGCKLGMPTTGNAGGVHNLRIDPTGGDLPSLLAEMGTGLYATELIGHGINPVTGDYSRGASGFWVENGEIQYPVEEITIAGNLKDMFRRLLAVGSDIDQRGNYHTGSWLIEAMTIAGE